jgi:thimet oligopeptidase
VTAGQLAGLPERYIQGLKHEGERYHISLQYPDLFPFMQYAHDETARRELSHKFWRKGGQGNIDRLAKMLELRQEQARLLGYTTHADYVTETRMAKNGHTVEQFLTGIIAGLAPAVQQELRDLVGIKKRVLRLDHPKPIEYYEVGYWSNRLRKERYDIDNELIREYLPTDHVMAAIMDIYQELLGLRFQKLAGVKLWHDDAQLYSISDVASGSLIGHFALDLYPRKDKYGHAAAFPVVLGRQPADGHAVTGMIALVCNFPRPTQTAPSLLSHDETETLFHEFGHVMHGLLSGGRWQRQNGFGVPMDFIEALSQIFEYWAWDPAVLARISKHYMTGQALPAELIAKMLAAKRHMEATYYINQAVSALYDLRLHMQPVDGPTLDSQQISQMYRDMHLEYEHIELPRDAIKAAGWGHMVDYAAGYYGYLWSKVYAADMFFSRFASDPLDAAVGRDYRVRVLAPGASCPEHRIVEDFLGRPSNDQAFLKELCI